MTAQFFSHDLYEGRSREVSGLVRVYAKHQRATVTASIVLSNGRWVCVPHAVVIARVPIVDRRPVVPVALGESILIDGVECVLRDDRPTHNPYFAPISKKCLADDCDHTLMAPSPEGVAGDDSYYCEGCGRAWDIGAVRGIERKSTVEEAQRRVDEIADGTRAPDNTPAAVAARRLMFRSYGWDVSNNEGDVVRDPGEDMEDRWNERNL